jgi:uncharacterized protein (TIGR00255 family)
LLALRGVLDVTEADNSLDADVASEMLASLEMALVALAGARAAEGQRLTAVLTAHIDEIERLTRQVQSSPSRTPEAIAARLTEQVARLTDASSTFDPARLHQEAILIATRSDVEEEIQRLAAHVASARGLLAESQPAGRKFDFLAQEFNREANTLCSKSSDIALTQTGLALKAVIDQFKEQVQNVE